MSKFVVLVPVSTLDSLARKTLEALKNQTFKDWACWLVDESSAKNVAGQLAEALGDDRIAVAPEGLTTLAKMMNRAIKDSGAEYAVPIPVGVLLNADALQKFDAHLESNPKCALVYSCYREVDASGKGTDVKVYQHEGAPHERFEFGFVKVYRLSAIQSVGGFREDLVHAAEYDMELKLADAMTLEAVDEVLYEAHADPTAVEESGEKKSGALHSPGKGKLGGFSYVFYPADLEKEITSVFEEMLRRRNAWIEHPTVPVKYPEKPYPVLATVVIPVFNRATFIGNALDRVLDGTYTEFEIVVVDNGSKDGTQDVVMEYVKKDPRVRLLCQTGPSISFALNCGIRAARGKYICQLDSDDEYKPETLEKMVGHMESHPNCGLAISYYELMDADRGELPEIPPVTHGGYTRNQILRRDGAGALRVFPKAVLEEMGLYDEENFGNFGEDYDMVLKTGEKYDVDRVHTVLYRYRRHSDNTDVTRDPLMKIQNKNNARLNAMARRKAINAKAGK
jgi:glycosyltransferase involved in cell wall biosynthesis